MNLFSRNTASEKRLIFVSMAISKSKEALRTRVPNFVSNFINFMQFSGENDRINRLGIDAPSPFGKSWIWMEMSRSLQKSYYTN